MEINNYCMWRRNDSYISKELAKKCKHLTTTAKNKPLTYEHDMVGYNYRMVNILASLGIT